MTTPLLLLALAWTAMHSISKDKTLIAGLMGTDAIMIACGLIADLSIGWVRTRSQEPELSNFYDKLVTYFTVLWIGYPTMWILGPSGLGFFNQTIDTLLFCVLPFFSKVGFSFLDLPRLRNLSSSRSRSTIDNSI